MHAGANWVIKRARRQKSDDHPSVSAWVSLPIFIPFARNCSEARLKSLADSAIASLPLGAQRRLST